MVDDDKAQITKMSRKFQCVLFFSGLLGGTYSKLEKHFDFKSTGVMYVRHK